MQTLADKDTDGSMTTQDEDEQPAEVSISSFDDELYRYAVPCRPKEVSKATCIRQALRERVGRTMAKQFLCNAQSRTIRDAVGTANWVLRTDCGHLEFCDDVCR